LAPACRKKVAAPPPLVNLKVGHLPVTGHAKFFVAAGREVLPAGGLNVQLSEFTNSADGLAAVARGPA